MEVMRSGAINTTTDRAMEGAVAVLPGAKPAPQGEFNSKKVSEEELKDAVHQANVLSEAFDRSLKFEYHREADIFQVSVIDTSKDEVVRKIPPDEIVRFVEHIKGLFGAMLDVTA